MFFTRYILLACGFVLSALQLGYAHAVAPFIFPFIPEHYTFSLQNIQEAVERKFPYQHTLAMIADLQLVRPRITLQPYTNRIQITLDAQLTSPWFEQPVNGVFSLSSQLAYQREHLAVVLKHVQFESLNLDLLKESDTSLLKSAAAPLLAQWLEDYPIMTFTPDQWSFANVRYEPGTIAVTPDGVRVQIVEIP